jgi:branched-chain amino acid transport system substrate-binding protein
MAFGVAACGDDDEPESGGAASEGGSKTLTVYSSLPLQGASRPQSEDVIKGIKLALKQKGGKCGEYPIKYDVARRRHGGRRPVGSGRHVR